MALALDQLHPQVVQAVSKLGWTALHPIQTEAIPLILDGSCDIIICAPTNAGKTEAVVLPILSNLLAEPATSFQALCISPLKALINDEYQRLTSLTHGMGIPVHRWHGDVDQERKQALRNCPRGILLITPESLESNFLNFSHLVPCLYRHLQYVVIDEFHAFLGNERGIHLLSLLSRLTDAIGRRPRRFALSATLGDPHGATAFLNSEEPEAVRLIQDDSTKRKIQVSVKTCMTLAPANRDEESCLGDSGESDEDAMDQIARDIGERFQGSTNLVFANSRRTVELLADRLQAMVSLDADNSYALHHGSLSRQVRHQTESALKRGNWDQRALHQLAGIGHRYWGD